MTEAMASTGQGLSVGREMASARQHKRRATATTDTEKYPVLRN